MFQGSRHVAKAEHFALVQGAGGVNNATTYFDRTNYFETLPSHQLELALWLEADRMATLLDALDQENLDNQREVVKNEKRQSYDNRPYGSFYEKLMAAVFPPEHPYHHTPIGSMEDLNAASIEDVSHVLPDLVRAEQRGAVDRRRRRRGRGALGRRERYFGPIPANPTSRRSRPAACRRLIGHERREVVPDNVPLTRVHFGFRCPPFGTREFDALEVASQILAGGTWQPPLPTPRARRADRPGRGRLRAAARRRRVASPAAGSPSGPRATPRRVEQAYLEELQRLADGARHRRRAGPGPGAHRGDELGALGGSRRSPIGCRCTRRCSTDPS